MNLKRYKHPKVCLCKRCQGTGKLVTMDARQEKEKRTQCPSCQGSGRVVVSAVLDLTITPYDPQSRTAPWYSVNHKERKD